jgi:acyl-CoA synthetase (AMP-forming)/AMP-acid ligase II
MRAERARPSGRPLRLRLCLVGAEQIDWQILSQAADAFAPRGLGIEVFTPAYGLAEATLAVAVSEPDQAPVYVDVDREALAAGQVQAVGAEHPAARRLVSAGAPLPGTTVRIEPQTSEIVVSSTSLASGYHNSDQATRERFSEDSFWTSDLGFVLDGQLYISGRSDDVLNIGGRSVHVLDLETRLGGEHGIRAGNCAIVDIDRHGRRQIGVVAEIDSEEIDRTQLAQRLRRSIMELGGVPVETFVFLPVGAFPKTPSGKVQRYRCREILSDPDTAGLMTSTVS